MRNVLALRMRFLFIKIWHLIQLEINLLTLCFHETLYTHGLDFILHSKYTSAPSRMPFCRWFCWFVPNSNFTTGISGIFLKGGNKEESLLVYVGHKLGIVEIFRAHGCGKGWSFTQNVSNDFKWQKFRQISNWIFVSRKAHVEVKLVLN